MKTLFVILALVTTPAFASWHYQPQGKRITLAQAAAEMAAGKVLTQTVFAEKLMYVELGSEDAHNQTWAVTNSVAKWEQAVDAKFPGKIIQSGRYRYKLGWNKLAELYSDNSAKMIYSTFDDYRADLKGSEKKDFQNEDDARGYITYTWDQSYQLLSLAGPDVTYYSSVSGDGGGAHPYAWAGMKHANVGYDQDSLLQLVDNQSLLDALKANPKMQKVGEELQRITQLTDLDRRGRELTEEAWGDGTSWAFGEGKQWNQFSIWDFDPATKMVTIRLGFEYTSEVVRGAFSQLEVTVKATDELAEQLTAVKEGRAGGQLMKDVPADKQPPMDGLQ